MRIINIIFIIITLSCGKLIPQAQTHYPMTYTQQDSLLVLEKRAEFKEVSLDRMSFLLEKIALSFVGAPYKPQTLEVSGEETLVINMQEFDCTTFVETCLALATTFKMGGHTFDSYQYILKRIRYRNGILDGYLSRLHYFTDWISDNAEKGYIKDASKIFGGIPYPNQLDFMSKHTAAYQQLAENPSLVKEIMAIEKKISARAYYYIPKENLPELEVYLEEGMIVAFTTSIKGLDVVHTGITTRQGDQIKLIHASSDAGKVIISEGTLAEYVAGNKSQTGIMLLKVD
jgi:hypothetical protein